MTQQPPEDEQPPEWTLPPAGSGGPPPQASSGWGETPTVGGYGHPGAGSASPEGPGQPAADGWGPAAPSGGYGQYGQYAGGSAGGADPYTARPMGVAQPGIIPLRPLSLGEIYEGGIKAIRANPVVMFVLSGIVVAVLNIIEAIVTGPMLRSMEEIAVMASSPSSMTGAALDEMVAMLEQALIGALVSALVSFVVTTLLNGLLTYSVSQAVIGRKLTLGQVWRQARGMLGRLLGLTLLIILLVLIPSVLGIGIVLLSGLAGEPGVVVVAGLLALLLVVGGSVFVITATVLATPVLMLEQSGVGTALKRSWQLCRPNFWRVLGIYLLTSILIVIVSSAVSYPVTQLGALISVDASLIGQVAGSTIASAVCTPFMAAVIALLYVDIRIRREGLDAELAAAAETP